MEAYAQLEIRLTRVNAEQIGYTSTVISRPVISEVDPEMITLLSFRGAYALRYYLITPSSKHLGRRQL